MLAELSRLGFQLWATTGTLAALSAAGVAATPVYRLSERRPHLVDQIRAGQFDLVINTITRGGTQESEGFIIRRAAAEAGVWCLTSLDTLTAAISGIRARSQSPFTVRSLHEWREDDVTHVALGS